jgi:hypothetical protein
MSVPIDISIRGCGSGSSRVQWADGAVLVHPPSRKGEYLINQQLYKLVIERSRLSGKALGVVN